MDSFILGPTPKIDFTRSNHTLAPISSQNTGSRLNGLTERPDGHLQPPFQNNAESFHNKASSGRCCPSVRTVALLLHDLPYQG
jgi:hypothetical protein